ncbi:MAG: bifunctional nuclease family protein [Chitinispirillaceae bacterium]|nr:bifunctional nuclease family protein [Chitinispirillaceae bacterium]
MIRVEIVNVFLAEKGGEYIILLKGDNDPRTLPISIGQLEAQSIAMELYHVSLPRPLTHDLFKSALQMLDSKVSKVIISDFIDNTYYARLFFETGGKPVEIDARPSDAIALALRFSAPVFVEKKVLDASGVVFPSGKPGKTAGKPGARAGKHAAEKETAEIPLLKSLKSRLAKAVRDESYEEAAKIRDEISKLTKSN